METLHCPTCLSPLPEGGHKRCPECNARLQTSTRPAARGRGRRRDAKAVRRIDAALAAVRVEAERETPVFTPEAAGRADTARALGRRLEPVTLAGEPVGEPLGEPSVDPDVERTGKRPRRFVVRAGAVLLLCALILAALWARDRRTPKAPAPARPSVALPVGTAPSKHWALRLDEEFNGSTLDSSRWATCYWWSSDGCTNGSSGELEWYQSANVRTVNGHLELEARDEPVTGDDGKGHEYTSGMVSGASPARNLFSFKYGYVVARAWVPRGPGLWAAFWMLPATHRSLPELDIFETVGERPDTADAHVHWSSSDNEMQLGRGLARPGLTSGWHTYAVDWEPDSVTWYIDGIKRWSVTKPEAVPSEPMYLLANLAVGGDYTTHPDETTPFPSSLKIDFIRVWRRI